MSNSRMSSAKTRRTPSARQRPTTGNSSKQSLLFAGQAASHLDALTNFRSVIAKRINEELNNMVWIKVLLVGPQHSGKTSLIRLFCENKFHAAYQATVGVDYGFKIHSCSTDVYGKVDVRVNFWDTAGRDDYFQVRNELYAETDVCVVVGDVSLNPSDQVGVLEAFTAEVDRYCRKPNIDKNKNNGEDEFDADYEAAKAEELARIYRKQRPFQLAICANKCDLLKVGRGDDDPSLREMRNFAAGQDLRFYETSCAILDTISVDNMFNELISLAAIRKLQQRQGANQLAAASAHVQLPN